MRPRVLLVLDHHVKYAAGLARGLHELGCPVLMVTRAHDWEFGRRPGAMRAYMERELAGDIGWAHLEGRVREPSGLASVLTARRAVRGFGPHVVHLQDSVVDDVRLLAVARLRPRRYAMTVHDASPHAGDDVRAAWKRALLARLVRRAGVVFVHADAVRDELLAREPQARVVVVPHGARAPLVAPLPERRSLLFFGRLSHYKGLDTLLDAMPTLWEREDDVLLTVAGEGPLPDHPVLHDPRVKVRHEHVAEEELPGLFAAASVVVLPYREASQSGVGTLAKRYGRALVVTNVGGLPELVDDRVGRLVPPEDPPALAAALHEVLATPGLVEAMGHAAAESAVADASFTRVAELSLEAYARYLGAGDDMG